MEIPKPSEDDRQFFKSLIPDEPAQSGSPPARTGVTQQRPG
jgi:hypothetical protein